MLNEQHRDDIKPTSLYDKTNGGVIEVTLNAMKENNNKQLIFFSSVAVYGINKDLPNENSPKDPFNDYAKSKWAAEQKKIGRAHV